MSTDTEVGAGTSARTCRGRVIACTHLARHASPSSPIARAISATRSALIRARPVRNTSDTVVWATWAAAGGTPSAARCSAMRAATARYDRPDAMRRD